VTFALIICTKKLQTCREQISFLLEKSNRLILIRKIIGIYGETVRSTKVHQCVKMQFLSVIAVIHTPILPLPFTWLRDMDYTKILTPEKKKGREAQCMF